MEKEYEPRIMRVDDYVAESLEHQADILPPSHKDEAEMWRDAAKWFRASSGTKMVRVWEVSESNCNT
jgi:hypothetical protein